MIINSKLILKEKNNKKQYYIKIIYDNNIIENYLVSDILNNNLNKKNHKKIQEKQNWIKNNYPELFI